MRSRRELARLILMGMVGVLVTPAPAAGSTVELFGPPPGALFAYSSGLEPGATLAGFVLPIDWSTRRDMCGPAGAIRSPKGLGWRYPYLCRGEEGDDVLRLQELLAEKKLFRADLTGVYDEATRHAVVTFHKLIGPAHTDPATAVADWLADPPPNDWSESDWLMLEAFEPRPPKHRPGQPDRIEVDIGHQVLYLIEDHQVEAIMPVSTGRGSGVRGCVEVGCGALVTPRTTRFEDGGRFYYEHQYAVGWSRGASRWSVYKGIFYLGHYGEWNFGIHGYGSVPAYPASHGCIRVTLWDMDFLRPWGESTVYDNDAARAYVGQVIHVWDA